MTKENYLKEVIMYTMQIASSDYTVMIITGERLYSMDQYDAEYVAKVMKDVSDKVVPYICTAIKPSNEFAETDDLLCRAFMFYFDKCVEMIYNIRVENGKGVDFNFEELFNGISGHMIPEYIQFRINKIISLIIQIYQKTFDFALRLNAEEIPLDFKIRTVLYSSIQLATEYAICLDLEDDSEFQHYLEN
jgi:hypothetical protein